MKTTKSQKPCINDDQYCYAKHGGATAHLKYMKTLEFYLKVRELGAYDALLTINSRLAGS